MAVHYIQNTGRNGEDIFLDKRDYMRFIFSLVYLNTDISVGKAGNTRYIVNRGYRGFTLPPRENQLVGIIAFCLVPPAFHLILREKKEGGISKFMQKVGTGYSAYINKRLGKKGGVFRGTYKTSVIQGKEGIREMSARVHRMPLEQVFPIWKQGNAANGEGTEDEFLEEYPWSSYLDYIRKRKLAFLDYSAIEDALS